jgi:hypothetical protein
MEFLKRLAKLAVFPLIIGVTLVVGRLIPAFYDWTGSDQSRSSPLVAQTAVGVLLCGIIVCLTLPWLPIEFDPPAADRGGVHAIALCYVVRLCVLCRSVRWPVASLLACMYFPFAWAISSIDQPNVFHILSAFALPAIFLILLVGGLLHQHSENLVWLSMVLTSVELLIGVWLLRLGLRRFIAYLVFVLIASRYGSFVLHALMRA